MPRRNGKARLKGLYREAAQQLRTVRDLVRFAVTRFEEARLAYGHGTDNALDEASARLIPPLRICIGEMLANIAERWNGRLFKRTGNLGFRVGVLTGSIRHMKKGNPDEGVGGPTPHAMLVELGTEKARAQPYLRPAMENNINAATDAFVREYEKALDRALARAKKKAVKGG